MIPALTVSAVQYRTLDGGVIPNVQEHVRLIEDAESHGSRLVVFPGLSLTGFNFALLAEEQGWLTQGDSRLDDLREILRRTGITAVTGGAYREPDGTPRFACLVIHPDGRTELGFKNLLHGPEQEYFRPGGGVMSVELDGWKVALVICSDPETPARCTGAAVAGADLCVVAGNYALEEARRLALHLGAVAMDNRMFAILANVGGSKSLDPPLGQSGIWGPNGLVIKKAAGTGTEVLTATLQRRALLNYR